MTDWQRRAVHAEQECSELRVKLRDAERRLTPYETPGALCSWCRRATVFVGGVAAAHPSCYVRALTAELREAELLRVIGAHEGDGVV